MNQSLKEAPLQLSTHEKEEQVKKLSSATLATCVWPLQQASSVKADGIVWVSRLRSGYNATDRRNARWTIESTFHYTDKTHEKLLSTSPEAYFHHGKPFGDPSLDVLVIDTSSEQNFESFLMNVACRLGSADQGEADCHQEGPLLDRALYFGRHMFRETV